MKPSLLNSNQSGQAILEYILMLVVVLMLGMMVRNSLQKTKFIQNFVFQPWGRLNGMVQCGTWSPCGVDTPTPGLHPNTRERVLSYDPKN